MSRTIVAVVACLAGCVSSEQHMNASMNLPDPWRKGPASYRELPAGDPKRQHICKLDPLWGGCVSFER